MLLDGIARRTNRTEPKSHAKVKFAQDQEKMTTWANELIICTVTPFVRCKKTGCILMVVLGKIYYNHFPIIIIHLQLYG